MPDRNDNDTIIVNDDKWRKWLDNDPPTHDNKPATEYDFDRARHEYHKTLHYYDGDTGIHHHHRGADDIIVCTANCADDYEPVVVYNDGARYPHQYGPRNHTHD